MSDSTSDTRGLWARFTAFMGWNKTSYALFGVFVLICATIVYVWWPLAEEYLALIDWEGEWWHTIDWLLIGIWFVMSLLIMRHADLRRDLPLAFVAFAGGLVIESWGTQTELWVYYTFERPPLWIIPAWPIATLAVERIIRDTDSLLPELPNSVFAAIYWLVFPAFLALMVIFVWPTIDKSLTIAALALCTLLIASPKDYRTAVLTFTCGVALGYFLELWGTTRLCWQYYTLERPPLFAVLAHGMAAVAFWRVTMLLSELYRAWVRPRLASAD